ncbi:MAG: serine dehydratase subunit alpha family protein, partial [Clostridia bacterium]|nr:serine dehydratase subunit alpha family protein [Clostridia bacterium]
MDRQSELYRAYIDILSRELVPAMGCTEPIAVAFCAAKAREELGRMPEAVHIQASGNIIKNVKSVIVPHSGGMRGLEAAAAVGILYGDSSRELEVISSVTKEQESELKDRMHSLNIAVSPLDSEHILDLVVTVSDEEGSVSVHIEDEHTNVVEIINNGRCVFVDKKKSGAEDNDDADLLTIADIFDFANTVCIDDVREIIKRQIDYNTAISKEGLENNYGARIGKLLYDRGGDIRTRACASAAAGSDARMGGCDMPVVICSGSRNQGMTASLPVITYAEHYNKSEEELYRALVLSNLVTLHLKSGIGRLS